MKRSNPSKHQKKHHEKPRHKKKNMQTKIRPRQHLLFKHFLDLGLPPQIFFFFAKVPKPGNPPFRREHLPFSLLQGVIDSTTRSDAANVGPSFDTGAAHGAHDADAAGSRQTPGGIGGDLTLPKVNILLMVQKSHSQPPFGCIKLL